MKFIHDPDCAIIRDVAADPDDEGAKHVPKCTCKERQASRRRVAGSANGGSTRGSMFSEGMPMGGGNYFRPVIHYSGDRSEG